jgi:membrane protein implicated in regulation of membrane protease activity
MALSGIRTSTPLNLVLVAVCLLLGGFLLFFSVANLIHPDVPDAYRAQNTLICLGASALGLVALLVALAAVRRLRRDKGTQRA